MPTLHARIIDAMRKDGREVYEVKPASPSRKPVVIRLMDSDYVIPDELRIDDPTWARTKRCP